MVSGAWRRAPTSAAASAYGSPPSASDHRTTLLGRKPMNDHRPTRVPCSADSSRKAGPASRSFRKADTGVSQSSMNVSATGTSVRSAATAIEHLLRVGEAQAAAAQQDVEVVEHVGGLLGDAVVGLVGGGTGDLVGLLAHLGADLGRVGEELRGVGAVGAIAVAGGEDALERRQRLVGRRRVELAVVEAGALARVAGRARGLDEGEQRVAVAVHAQGLERLRVARGGALVPELVARAAPEVHLAGLARPAQGLGVHVRQRQHLTGAPVL